MAPGRSSILEDPSCVRGNAKDGNGNFRNELMSQRKHWAGASHYPLKGKDEGHPERAGSRISLNGIRRMIPTLTLQSYVILGDPSWSVKVQVIVSNSPWLLWQLNKMPFIQWLETQSALKSGSWYDDNIITHTNLRPSNGPLSYRCSWWLRPLSKLRSLSWSLTHIYIVVFIPWCFALFSGSVLWS